MVRTAAPDIQGYQILPGQENVQGRNLGIRARVSAGEFGGEEGA